MSSLLLLLISAPLSHAELSSVLKAVPPRSYANLLMSLMPKLRVRRWLLQSLLWLSVLVPMLLESLLSSRAVLLVESPSRMLRLLLGACTRGFAIASASLFPMLETLATTCARWLFVLASVSSVRLGDAAAIGEGGGGVDS